MMDNGGDLMKRGVSLLFEKWKGEKDVEKLERHCCR